MKLILILIIVLGLSSELSSQVTLTNTINPTAGNTQMVVDCDTNGVVQGNSGANQIWNFTSLTRIDSTQLSWVLASATPYAAQFTTSNVASTNDNTSFNYFTTSAANLLTNGAANPVSVISYNNAELFMQYPFTYNSTFTDNFSAVYDQGGIQTYRTGSITVTGDAWGTLNLPFGSFINALRVKYMRVTKDSSNAGVPVVFVTNLTSYVWFVPGRKFPVLEIIYTSLTFNGAPFSYVKAVNYNSNSTPIGITLISTEVPQSFKLYQNYPNPFNPSTKISFSIPVAPLSFGEGLGVRLVIYDILGKETAVLLNEELSPGTYEVDWNASTLPSGVYYYRLIAGSFSETKKIILVK